MLGILTNDTDNPVPLDHLAFVANRLYARSDFHPYTPTSSGGLAAYIKSDIGHRPINTPTLSGEPAAYVKSDIGHRPINTPALSGEPAAYVKIKNRV
jgi:hypothetical protein